MIRPRTVETDHFRGMEYGYLWWIIDREKNIYAAIGNSGNVIYINPEKNIVIAVSSYFKPTIFDRVDFILVDELGSVVILKNNAPRYLVIDFSKADESALAKDEDVLAK